MNFHNYDHVFKKTNAEVIGAYLLDTLILIFHKLMKTNSVNYLMAEQKTVFIPK